MNGPYPDTLPIPVSMPPAGTSSFPYNSYAANWENSKNGVLQQNKNGGEKQNIWCHLVKKTKKKDKAVSF